MTAKRAASVHARLLARAKARAEDFNLTLMRYALERFLYRLSVSAARDRFCLKGALLFDLWFGVPHRPTRDADFLGFGPAEAGALAATVREVCGVEVDDGMEFDPASVTVEEIRENARYGGLRVKLRGRLGNARCTVQLDVGFGDTVTPAPEEVVYPTLLDDHPAPRLLAYPRAAMVAEKLEAMVSLGMANSRMKDYFDVLALAREAAVEGESLADAIAATFTRRGTAIPETLPLGLGDEFTLDPTKQAQWGAFLKKNRLDAPGLAEAVAEIRTFVAAPLRRARNRVVKR